MPDLGIACDPLAGARIGNAVRGTGMKLKRRLGLFLQSDM